MTRQNADRRDLAAASDAAGAQTPGRSPHGMPDLLFYAVQASRFDVIAESLAAGRDANVRMDDGATPLMLAARLACLESIRLLLPASDARLADDRGRTALIIAAKHEKAECVEALLDASDPDQADENGCSALAHAAARGNADCVRALLRRANPRTADRHGYTPLMRAAAASHPSRSNTQSGFSSVGRLACARLLLPVSDPDAQDSSGATALMHAASDDDAELVRMLLPRSNARVRDASGHDALSWAIHVSQRNSREIARMLAPASDLSIEVVFGAPTASAAAARATEAKGTPLEMAAMFCGWGVADDLSLFAPIDALKKTLALAGRGKMPQAWARLEAFEIQSAANEAILSAPSPLAGQNAVGNAAADSPPSAGARSRRL